MPWSRQLTGDAWAISPSSLQSCSAVPEVWEASISVVGGGEPGEVCP